MVLSLNSKTDLTIKAQSFHDMNVYGNIIVGNKAFEFYNQRNVNDYIQIPWDEIDEITVVFIKNNYIPRFEIKVKDERKFMFSSKDNRILLRAINKYVDRKKIKSKLSFFQTIVLGLKNLFKKPSNI